MRSTACLFVVCAVLLQAQSPAHQPTDLYSTYSDKDFRLGLNAAQTTLGAVAQLTGATVKK